MNWEYYVTMLVLVCAVMAYGVLLYKTKKECRRVVDVVLDNGEELSQSIFPFLRPCALEDFLAGHMLAFESAMVDPPWCVDPEMQKVWKPAITCVGRYGTCWRVSFTVNEERTQVFITVQPADTCWWQEPQSGRFGSRGAEWFQIPKPQEKEEGAPPGHLILLSSKSRRR